jgi:predicted anti-sigma-YlaC factor YlaD
VNGERPGERLAGDLWCSDVLGLLSDVLDGGLAPEVQGRVQVHLAACDQCSRFGDEFARVIRDLREGLGAAEEPEPEVETRLAEHLTLRRGPGRGGADPAAGS